MNLSQPIVIEALGWTLAHSLWQLALAAVLAALALLALRRHSARLRYAVCSVALGAAAVLPAATFLWILPEVKSPVAVESRAQPVIASQGPAQNPLAVLPEEPSTPGRRTEPQASRAVPQPTRSAKDGAFDASFTIESALPFAVGGWLLGVLLLAVWRLGGWLLVQRLRSREVAAVSAELRGLLARTQRRLNVPRTVELLTSARLCVPSVVGWLKPAILLPAAIVAELPIRELELVLAHELAHVRRYDYLLNLLQTIVETLLFYHPAVWWLSWRMRVEREHCADEVVVALCGDPVMYARTLMRVAEFSSSSPAWVVAADGGSLRGRIERILGRRRVLIDRRGWLLGGLVGLAFAAGIVAAPPAFSERPSDDPEGADISGASNRPEERGDDTAATAASTEEENDERQDRDLDRHAQRGVAYLVKQQRPDGSWRPRNPYQTGATAITTLALLRCGLTIEDDAVKRGVEFLRSSDTSMVYEVSLKALVYTSASLDEDRPLLQQCVDQLERGQAIEGDSRGGWSYRTKPTTRADASNSEFAVWALSAAAEAGAAVDDATWRRVRKYWLALQNADGSWGYTRNSPGTGSMTCSGIASLAECDRRQNAEPAADARRAIERGLAWMAENFSVRKNPGSGQWNFYYLMTLRRAGELAGRRRLGRHDWYAEGAQFLAKAQHPTQGFWLGDATEERLLATAFGLLFLQRGAPPLAAPGARDQAGAAAAEVDATVTGRVVDAENHPLSRANVWIIGSRHAGVAVSETLTNAEGQFELQTRLFQREGKVVVVPAEPVR